jgi:hypothetical protein
LGSSYLHTILPCSSLSPPTWTTSAAELFSTCGVVYPSRSQEQQLSSSSSSRSVYAASRRLLPLHANNVASNPACCSSWQATFLLLPLHQARHHDLDIVFIYICESRDSLS